MGGSGFWSGARLGEGATRERARASGEFGRTRVGEARSGYIAGLGEEPRRRREERSSHGDRARGGGARSRFRPRGGVETSAGRKLRRLSGDGAAEILWAAQPSGRGGACFESASRKQSRPGTRGDCGRMGADKPGGGARILARAGGCGAFAEHRIESPHGLGREGSQSGG